MRIATAAAASALAWMSWLPSAQAAPADDGAGGVTYGQMEKALKEQGYSVIQTTSIGDRVPKSQCLVIKELTSANGHATLSLDCRGTPKASSAGPTAVDSAAG